MLLTRKKIYLSLVVLFASIVTIFFYYFNNFYTLIPQQYYRSAQLSKTELTTVIEQKQLQSVINLRGAWPKNTWYQDEVSVTTEHGVALFNIKLPAKGLPPVNLFKELVTILTTAPKPALIHCERGADRTGLASAMVLLLNENASYQEAITEVNWLYGAIDQTSIGKVVLPIYHKWLIDNHLKSSRANFLFWVNHLQAWDKAVPAPAAKVI